MRIPVRWMQVSGAALALLVGVPLVGHFLLAPVTGEVLVLASSRQPDSLEASSVELHLRDGWSQLGTFGAHSVPAAPDTATLLTASAPVGSYDAIRIGGIQYPIRLSVTHTVLETVLVAVEHGQPARTGVYAGTESVSLGLNELSGQLRPMPQFDLLDQFGRAFSNASVAGRPLIIAAFHTTCHTTCPLYTGLFMELRRRLPSNVLLIEATVAPEEDTPHVLRDYAGRTGASWIFLTGTRSQMEAFWVPFTVQLSDAQEHSSMLAVIDEHGYIRTVWQGVPDVGGSLPPQLVGDLNASGLQELASHGSEWGVSQVLDSLDAVGGLAVPSTGGEGVAPDFKLSSLDGHTVNLSDYRGRPVMINFWATYCVPCRREMPMLQREANSHPGMALLLIDERDDRAAALAFVRELGITSTVPFDPDGKVGDLYHLIGLPTTIFIRGDGSIEGRYIGETNEQILGPHLSAIRG